MEFENYVEAYANIWERVNDKDVALAILAEVAKDRRQAKIANWNAKEKATQSQIEYLKDLGVELTPGLTKAEASELIGKARLRK